jgi:AcrR family transcriptional regulator
MADNVHTLPVRGPAPAPAPRTDGRRERSKSSRARIVAAMLDLVERGDVQPSAARVADEAGVGLRTVFRHFDDMDSLYREMTEVIEARVMPLVLRPYGASDWRDNLRELAKRRAEVFEAILPFRISANIKRYQSPYLMAEYVRMMKLERQFVTVLLPPAVLADDVGVEALCVAVSFQSWRVMRHDQGLTSARAAAVIARLVDNALAALPD